MKKIFNDFGINLTENQLEKFNKYYNLLVEYNNKFNITAITEKKEVCVKHFIDSILATSYFKCGKLLDVGSGGGFPAIPLKIMLDELDVTMLEATGKKCEFLKEVISQLNLKNISVINGRAEDLAKDTLYREKFDYCTARAVARLNTLCEYCMPFVKVNGKFISYKGEASEEILEANNAIKVLGGRLESENNYLLEDAKRCIVVIEKVCSTPLKYPRGNGKERKNPL